VRDCTFPAGPREFDLWSSGFGARIGVNLAKQQPGRAEALTLSIHMGLARNFLRDHSIFSGVCVWGGGGGGLSTIRL
jgi:hypothetical protein